MTVREMMNKGIIQEEEAYACFPNLDYSPSLADAEKRLARRITINETTEGFQGESHYIFPILLSAEERTAYAKLGGAIPKYTVIGSAIAGQTLSEVNEILIRPAEIPVTKPPVSKPVVFPTGTPVPGLQVGGITLEDLKKSTERYLTGRFTVKELVDYGYITMQEAINYFGNLSMTVNMQEAESILGRKMTIISDVRDAITEKPVLVEKTDWIKIAVPIGIAILMLL